MNAYKTNQDLPASIRDRVPASAQDLYRIAFNCAIQWYGNQDKAHRAAWSAVRNQAASLNSAIWTEA